MANRLWERLSDKQPGRTVASSGPSIGRTAIPRLRRFAPPLGMTATRHGGILVSRSGIPRRSSEGWSSRGDCVGAHGCVPNAPIRARDPAIRHRARVREACCRSLATRRAPPARIDSRCAVSHPRPRLSRHKPRARRNCAMRRPFGSPTTSSCTRAIVACPLGKSWPPACLFRRTDRSPHTTPRSPTCVGLRSPIQSRCRGSRQCSTCSLSIRSHRTRRSFPFGRGWRISELRTTTVLRFLPPSGGERAFEYVGDPGLVRLDPRWHQAALGFVRLGFGHILDGIDHLLFVFCLVIPFRRIRPLVAIVTSFTVAHSITLIASASGSRSRRALVPAVDRGVDRALDRVHGVREHRRPEGRTAVDHCVRVRPRPRLRVLVHPASSRCSSPART